MTDDRMTNDRLALCHLSSVICHLKEPLASSAATNSSGRKVHMARRGRKVRKDGDRKVRTVCRDRKASTRDRLFALRARPSTFGH